MVLGSFGLTRSLVLALLASTGMSLAKYPTNASTNVVYGMRSHGEKKPLELESLTQSSTCFSGGTCAGTVPTNKAYCNSGAYIYQITGYSGSNFDANHVYANRIDFLCSDGEVGFIGQEGSIVTAVTTLTNPNGFQSTNVAGGCITDHIQIGGLDIGNAGWTPTASCDCAAGLSLVGFPSLPYQTYWPSFQHMAILCDTFCPKGTFSNNGQCLPCPKGEFHRSCH